MVGDHQSFFLEIVEWFGESHNHKLNFSPNYNAKGLFYGGLTFCCDHQS